MSSGHWVFVDKSNFSKMSFNWSKTQRKVAVTIIPMILERLKDNAPVSQTHPDAGRFKKSIGFRVDSSPHFTKISFVSTAPYAKYVLYPTAGGTLIQPNKTMALRWQGGFGEYVFATSVVRGATKGNDFNQKVAHEVFPLLKKAFKDSVISVGFK